MKIGRNALCPCGSGKKHKKCCYGKDQSAAAAREAHPRDSRDDSAEMRETLLRAVNNMRRYTLDKKPHIKEYYRTRKLHGEIVNAMIQYHDEGKFERVTASDPLPQSSREPLVYLFESSFDLESRAGAQGFYDMLIYKPAPNMNCITEDFLQKRRYRKAEKIELLHSMLDSTPGLFEVTGIDADQGYACLKEVFTAATYKIIDIGLSGDKNYDRFYLYTRIIKYHGICFGTGLNLVFTKTDPFIKEHIRQHQKNYSPLGEFLRFTQLYNQYSQSPDKIKVVANTLK